MLSSKETYLYTNSTPHCPRSHGIQQPDDEDSNQWDTRLEPLAETPAGGELLFPFQSQSPPATGKVTFQTPKPLSVTERPAKVIGSVQHFGALYDNMV